ncbi:carboxypeptidase-like regulatory domain-containing protein [Flavobacteriaceae bacterium]|nr:carboxypeptidase-like regulatory domain-containing protein [Flavobacteriaceae bacterium]
MICNPYLFLFLFITSLSYGQITIQDKETKEPISFATISFGNGNGLFADEEGKFVFTKKQYSDIDTLTISSVGYKGIKITTENLPLKLLLEPKTDLLEEVIVQVKPKGKFKLRKIKPVLHDDYFKCWLPTIESEIAVYFPNDEKRTKQITKLFLPIKAEASDWSKRKKANSKKRSFSTLLKVKFYENNNGFPGEILSYEKVVFRVTHESEAVFELDISKNDIFIPKKGIFVSIQVLGYTNKEGKLLPNKKYQEVKTRKGIVKVSTTFRPLLPFTEKIAEKRTFTKRIFLDDNDWIKFEQKNVPNNKLLLSGLNNYGMGMEMKVYQEKNNL